jgi:hypothetical protein
VGYGIAFAPLVAPYVLWAAAAACAVLAALLALGRTRGALLRASKDDRIHSVSPSRLAASAARTSG